VAALAVVALAACQSPPAGTGGQRAAPAAPAAPSAGGGAAPAPASASASAPAPASASASAPAPAPTEHLRVAWVSASGGYLPLWLAHDAGLFQQRGLTVEPIFTSGPQAVQSLLAREVDIAYTDGAALVRAALAGGDTVILGSTTNVFPFKLIAHPSIRRVEDLRGKRLGITRAGATTDTAARYLLRGVGLAPDADVALIQTGTTTEMLSAMVAGGIDGGLMSEPIGHHALKQGYVFVYDLATLGIEYPTTGIGTLRSILNERPAALRAYVGGITEAIARINRDRTEALEVLARLTKMEDPEALEATYDEYVPRFPRAPYPTEASISTVLDSIREGEGRTVDARPGDFIDPRFVRELDESGYIRGLYP
jgi:ABC-type nitrate/sulfonate/bicarbonate transport system substrate-binding protein